MKIFKSSLVILLLSIANQSLALKIVINQGIEGNRPIAIVPFKKVATTIEIDTIIKNNLLLSGVFNAVPNDAMPNMPYNFNNIRLKNWRPLADSMIVGSAIRQKGITKIRLELIDIFKKTRLGLYQYNLKNQSDKNVRKVAHKLTDLIYKKLTGQRGVFTTKLAYVSVKKNGYDRTYSLDISGIDGRDSVSIFQSNAAILSPAWSSDGRKIAFVSFQNNKAEIWIKNLKTNQLYLVLRFNGNISAPSFSPDDTKLAVTLVKDGNAEIYVMDLVSKIPKRMTHQNSVDTEATWSANGQILYFLSDRYKKQAQIYKMRLDKKIADKPKRVTHNGNYNTSPDISPNDENLVMLHRTNGQYKIAIQNLKTGRLKVISKTKSDEAPSFSPNSEMIVYASKIKNRGVITITNKSGTMHKVYSSGNGDIREPSWSPYLD